MRSMMFYGKKISANTEKGVYNHTPYVVMHTEKKRITVMVRRKDNWFVKVITPEDSFYKAIIRRRLSMSNDYATSLMAHDRARKKKSQASGGSSENLTYKQVTVYAYWANLENSKSGNASVVASNFYD